MHLLIATDSFKDALPAEAVCRAIAAGIRRRAPSFRVEQLPLADGGEGTAAILTRHRGGVSVEVEVHDPLMRPVRARYGWVAEEKLAFIDMAQASGLQLLTDAERDPRRTSTYGTGELIAHAIDRGARRIVLGVGGSATNDAGIGMAAALGYRFLGPRGQELEPVGGNLGSIERLDAVPSRKPLASVEVEVITDVDNPLCGPQGASRVYAPQKGADEEAVASLEAGMQHLAALMEAHCGRPLATLPGAGAAGGLGAGGVCWLGGHLRSGIEAVMAYTDFDARLAGKDLVLTGEGRLDAQTAHGKLIAGLCHRARQQGVPVIALCGSLEADPDALQSLGLAAAFSILPQPLPLSAALAGTATYLEHTASAIAGTLLAGRARPS